MSRHVVRLPGILSPCPFCGRRVEVKTLRWCRQCGRTFDPDVKAREQAEAAAEAVKKRMARKTEGRVEKAQRTNKVRYEEVVKRGRRG